MKKAADEYIALLVETSPETATTLGIHTRDTELDDRSREGVQRVTARKEQWLAGIRERFSNLRLSPAAKVDAALIVSMTEEDLEKRKVVKPLERLPHTYTDPLDAIFQMTARDYAPLESRATNALARIAKVPANLASAKSNLKQVPRVWAQVGLESAKGASAFFDSQRPILVSALPTQKDAVDAAIRDAKAAYEKFAQHLEREIIPKAPTSFAVGRPYFTWLLRHVHFIEAEPETLYLFGERVYRDTENEMNAIARQIDPKSQSWVEVVQKLKARHPTSADLIQSYRAEVNRARAYLVAKDAVPFPEGERCEVIPTPEYLRPVISAAYDQPPPFDAGKVGFFFVTPVEQGLSAEKQEEMLREHDYGDQADTAVHEAYPGHHLQLSFSKNHPSLVRKIVDAPTLSEGWALYSEELMHELRYYTPEERLMQLQWTLVRAARILFDVGLHTRGMSYDEAVRFLTDRVHLARPLAESEIKRYTIKPTQPLSYLVGREGIVRLREKYKKSQGNAFSLKEFHSRVLSVGNVPVGLLEKEVLGGAPN